MRPSLAQLEAVVAVVDHQSFESAARALGISLSALSQRVSGLERLVGHPVVTRSRPAQVTAPGESVLRVARHVERVFTEGSADLASPRDPAPDDVDLIHWSTVAVAVNADSLSTWFGPVLRWFSGQRTLVRLRIEDQDRTARLLERAEVLAAVSTTPTAQAGCRATPLGAMRYLPACAPEILPPDGLAPELLPGFLSQTPTLRFDSDDHLPGRLAERFGVEPADLRAHLVPSNREYLDAVRAGLGWSVLPEAQVSDDLARGTLVRLPTDVTVDVALHWHRWRLPSRLLDAMEAEVLRCARAGLHVSA